MAARPKLTPEQIDAILRAHEAGATLLELAARYEVSPGAIGWHVRRHRAQQEGPPLPPDQPRSTLAAALLALLPGDWVIDALCAQVDPELFFPEKGGSTREAKAVCARCPVRPECLEYALDNTERYGIYGGLSERERRRLLRIHQARVDGAA